MAAPPSGRLPRRAAGAGLAAWLAAPGRGRAGGTRPAAADTFVDSVGVNTHLSSAPYAENVKTVLPLLARLHLRHVRDELRPDDRLDNWRALHAAAGIRAHLLTSPATSSIAAAVDYVAALGPALVAAVEGQNEGDSPWFSAQVAAREGWAGAVVAHQRALFAAVRARWPAAVLPVVSPTVLDYRPADMGAIRAAAPFSDVVALHAYPQGWREPETTAPFAALGWYLTEMRDRFKPGAPAMITETGYPTVSGALSPRAAAIYLPRLLLHAWDRGIVRTFIYELLDEGGDRRDPETAYGLVDRAFAPKPAFDALAALLGALADPGPAHPVSGFAVVAEGAPAELRLSSFERRDGTVVLAAWRALPSYDVRRGRDLHVAPVPVRLRLSEPVAHMEAMDLAAPAAWTELGAGGSVLDVPVGDAVTLLRLSRS